MSLAQGCLPWPVGGTVDNEYAGCVLVNVTRSAQRLSAILLRGDHYDGRQRCFTHIPRVVIEAEGWTAEDTYVVRRDLRLEVRCQKP
jgi:hypothetical protein